MYKIIILSIINLKQLVWQLKMYSSNFSVVASGDRSGMCELTNQGFQRESRSTGQSEKTTVFVEH